MTKHKRTGSLNHSDFDSWDYFVHSGGTIGSLADPIPETATILLFGAGLVGLSGLKKRKK